MCKVEVRVDGESHIATVREGKDGLLCSFSPPLRDKDGDFVFCAKLFHYSISSIPKIRLLRSVGFAAFFSLGKKNKVEIPEISKLMRENKGER